MSVCAQMVNVLCMSFARQFASMRNGPPIYTCCDIHIIFESFVCERNLRVRFLLFARVSTCHCHNHSKSIQSGSFVAHCNFRLKEMNFLCLTFEFEFEGKGKDKSNVGPNFCYALIVNERTT